MRPGGWAIVAAGLAVVVAGCVLVGGADDVPTVRVTVRDLAYDRDVYRAPAGRIRVELRGLGTHTLVVPTDDAGASTLIAWPAPPARSTVVVVLPPGEYRLMDNVPGHRAAGEEAVLIVTDDG